METIAERLSAVIKERGITQVGLEKISGVGQGRITNIVTGRTKDPQGTTIIKICKALNLNPFWLIMGWGKKEKT